MGVTVAPRFRIRLSAPGVIPEHGGVLVAVSGGRRPPGPSHRTPPRADGEVLTGYMKT